MDNQNLEIINSKELREELISRVDVLSKVKELFTVLDGYMTVDMVAEYYSVTKSVVGMCVKNNKDEIESDGYNVFKRSELEALDNKIILLSKKGSFDVLNEGQELLFSGSNRGVALFTQRAVLRVGMLLRDSEVAKEVRTQLLNLHDNVQIENPNLVVKEIDEEVELVSDITRAMIAGDVMALSLAHCKYNEYKNRLIKPKIEAYDTFMDSDGTYTTRNACKMLELSERKVFAWLREKELVFKNRTEATAKAVDMGIFKHKIKGIHSTMVITPEGIEYLRNNCSNLIK